MSAGQNQMFPGLHILNRFYTITLQMKVKAFLMKSVSVIFRERPPVFSYCTETST